MGVKENMREYKQWFSSDENAFCSEAYVYFSDCGADGRMSLNELLRVTSDIATEDFTQRGLSREYLNKNDFGVLVSRSSFKFHRMPLENERYLLITKEEKPEPFQLVRSYEFTNENGESLISGISTWIVVCLSKRKIVPTSFFNLRKAPELSFSHDCAKPARLSLPKDMILLDRRMVHYSDLDGYGHTNNSKYGNFIIDSLPVKYCGIQYTDFKINYSKEVRLGDKLDIYGAFDDEAKRIVVVGRCEGRISFEAEIHYA